MGKISIFLKAQRAASVHWLLNACEVLRKHSCRVCTYAGHSSMQRKNRTNHISQAEPGELRDLIERQEKPSEKQSMAFHLLISF